MKNLYSLLDAIHKVYDNKTYKPLTGITFCNVAMSDIALKMGCYDLEGKLANEICDFMAASPEWVLTDMNKTQALANQGSLVYAVRKDTPHGHICVICPGIEQDSGHWGKTPSVCNIGRDNFISKGVRYAFTLRPEYYAWRKSL